MSRVHTSPKVRREGLSSLQHSETCSSSHTCSETGSSVHSSSVHSGSAAAHAPPDGEDRVFHTLGRPVRSKSSSFLFQHGALKPFLTPTLRRPSSRHVQQVHPGGGTPRRPKKAYGENVDPLLQHSKVSTNGFIITWILHQIFKFYYKVNSVAD